MIRLLSLTTTKPLLLLLSTTSSSVVKANTFATPNSFKSIFHKVNPTKNLPIVRNLHVTLTDFIVAKRKKKDKSFEYSKTFKRSKSTIKKNKKKSKICDKQNMNNDNNQNRRKYDRHWLQIPNSNGGKSSSKGMDLTVMSYNVLAQHLVNMHGQLYTKHLRQNMQWPERFSRLMTNITEVQPHILCLQEVQKSHLNQYHDELKKKNLKRYIYKKRRSANYQDGCAIFYNPKLFHVIEQHCIEYFRPNVPLLDRPNVAIIVKFQSIDDPNIIFIVATTHLLYNPKREDVRLAQIQLLLAEIDRISFLHKDSKTGKLIYAPIILTGDFNLKPNSAPHHLLTNGSLNYSGLTLKRLEKPSSHTDMDNLTGNMILPISLGITDHCQHFEMVCKNKNDDFNTKVYCNDVVVVGDDNKSKLINEYTETQLLNSGQPFQTGTLQHTLNFRSVYDINRDKRITATTFHDEWITVDYMFYSLKYKKYEEEFIKLIAIHELPTMEDLIKNIQMIPNEWFGSDHFSLAAKFIILPILNKNNKSDNSTVPASVKWR